MILVCQPCDGILKALLKPVKTLISRTLVLLMPCYDDAVFGLNRELQNKPPRHMANCC